MCTKELGLALATQQVGLEATALSPHVIDQASWPPKSIEIDLVLDKKFRQGFIGPLLQQKGVRTNSKFPSLFPEGSKVVPYMG